MPADPAQTARGRPQQVDLLYEAYGALRRADYSACRDICTELLARDPSDQAALLLRAQCAIENTYFDETEFEEGALDPLIAKQEAKQAQTAVARLATSLGTRAGSARPVSGRATTGFVRPLTCAAGKPQSQGPGLLQRQSGSRAGSRAGSRVGGLRTASRTASAASRAGYGSVSSRAAVSRAGGRFTRLGTATVSGILQRHAEGDSGRDARFRPVSSTADLTAVLSELPLRYGMKPLYRRILVNYFLRLLPEEAAPGGDGEQGPLDATPDPRRALAFLREYSKEYGCDWFYNDRAGRAYILLGSNEEAERHFRAALRVSERLETELKLASSLARRSQSVAALGVYLDASEKFRWCPAPPLAAARLFTLLSDYRRAVEQYGQAVLRNGGNIEAMAVLGALLLDSLSPQTCAALSAGAGVSFGAGAELSALRFYQRVLLRRTGDPAVWANIGVCHMRNENYGQAFLYLLTAVQRLAEEKRLHVIGYNAERLQRLSADIWYNLGLVFLSTADNGSARECFETAILSDSRHSEALTNLAVLCSRDGNDSRAMVLLSKALDADPGNGVARQNRALLWRRRHSVERAVEDAEGVLLDRCLEELE